MKKYLLLVVGLFLYGAASAQVYRGLNIVETDYVTIDSYSGIEAKSILPNYDGSYKVELFNANYNSPSTHATYSFEWYLSYKGKRVSDYYKSAMACRISKEHIAWVWPNEVPQGYERFVTVQLGKQPQKRDRRDDD